MATVAMPVAAKGKRDVCSGEEPQLRAQGCPVTIGAGDTTVVVAAADP
jgi:hypothetical protein